METSKVSEPLQKALKTLLDHYDDEDKAVRERQIKEWKRLKLYWDGYPNIWYDEVAHDWRIYGEKDQTDDQSYYNKPQNVFKAYLESIIAALSITIPPIACLPADADHILDVNTAKVGDKIGQLIGKHNKVSLLWLKALYILSTEGMIAAYNYPKEDRKFGVVKEDILEDQERDVLECPECGSESGFEHDVEISMCPECGSIESPVQNTITETITTGTLENLKSRQMIEVYGGLQVKIPNYARNQEDVPYLIHMYETHFANVLAKYRHLKDKIQMTGQSVYSNDSEVWGRTSIEYRGDQAENNVTVRNAWFRASAFTY